jgi:hypothetical protein
MLVFFGLFERVHLEYLPVDSIEKFIELSVEHLDELNGRIWSRVCARLKNRVVEQHDALYFQFHARCPLNGILSHLSELYGGNIHALGIVEVTGQPGHSEHSPRNVVDFKSGSYFESIDHPQSSLCLDLKEMRVDLTHYSIRLAGHRNWNYLTSWVVLVSPDGNKWVPVDKHVNYASTDRVCSFPTRAAKGCRFVKILQTLPTPSGWTVLCLRAFEIFGHLRFPQALPSAPANGSDSSSSAINFSRGSDDAPLVTADRLFASQDEEEDVRVSGNLSGGFLPDLPLGPGFDHDLPSDPAFEMHPEPELLVSDDFFVDDSALAPLNLLPDPPPPPDDPEPILELDDDEEDGNDLILFTPAFHMVPL